jgi:transposase
MSRGGPKSGAPAQCNSATATPRRLLHPARRSRRSGENRGQGTLGLIAATGSTLSELVGIADRSEAELLIEVGDPRRFTGEGGLARFNGSAPLPASSGEGNGPPRRHRLSRGGNRRVNAVLHRMAITQLRCEPKAREIYDRARQRGHTKRELGYTCNVVASSATPSLEMRALQLE